MERWAFPEPSQDQAISETDLPCAHGGSHIIREGKKMSPCFLLVIVLLTSVCCPCLSSGILGMALFFLPDLTAPRMLNNQVFCFSSAAATTTTPALDFSATKAAYTACKQLYKLPACQLPGNASRPSLFLETVCGPVCRCPADASQEG